MRQRLISAPVNIVLPVPVWPEHDRVVARVGEPVEHDRRAARPGPPVQVPRGLVQVRRGVEEGGGERCRVEVALGERPRCRTRQGRPPGVGEPERRDLELEPRAPALEPRRLDPLGEARAVIRLEEQDRIDEVDPAAARLDRTPRSGRRVAHPLALHVAELAPLGGQPVGRPDLAQARRHERHRLGAPERPDPHRDRANPLDREELGQPAGLDLRRPASGRREGRQQLLARDHRRADPVLRPGPSDGGPQRAELRGFDLARGHAPLLGRAGEARHRPPQLGLARRVEQQIGAPQRPAWGGGDLAVQRGIRGERPYDPLALDPRLHRRQVLVGVPLGGDRDELERSRDRVVEGGERLEGRVPLRLGHQLEIDRGELEPSDEVTADVKLVIRDASARTLRGPRLRPPDLRPPDGRPAGVGERCRDDGAHTSHYRPRVVAGQARLCTGDSATSAGRRPPGRVRLQAAVLGGRSRTRRRSWAFAATMIVDRLIAIAPTAIGRSMPHGTKRPIATGIATRL